MIEALQFEFMSNALVAGLLAGVICGVIGTLVVVNRLVFLSGGIAHAAYGGIGMALYFQWPYLVGTLGFSMLAAMVMAGITLNAKHRADTIVGALWAVGMALGILLTDLTPGYHADLMSYLFGSILTVSKTDLWIMLAVALTICSVVSFYYHDFLAMSYDDEFARIRGIHTRLLYGVLVAMVALTVVMVIQVVGLILVIALLTIPPYIAQQYTRSLAGMMFLASGLSILFSMTGLWVSYRFNLTAGAMIILVAGVGFLLSSAARKLLRTPVQTG